MRRVEGWVACLIDVDVELLDTLEGELVTLDENPHGLVHELAGDLKGLWGEGGREDPDLELGREELENVVNLVLETTREHLVGLIQNKHLSEQGMRQG